MKDTIIDSVLVADDDPLLVLLFAQILKDLGVKEISTACDGKRAIELYKKYCPDLVILDLEMPIKNGYEAAKDIKLFNPNAKIVMLTGNPTHHDIEKALHEGVITSLFIKPISIDIIDKILLRRAFKKGTSKRHEKIDKMLDSIVLSRDLIGAA